MPLTRYYIATSADGFVAEADGGVAWLERFTDDSGYGYAPFYEAVGTLIMGRADIRIYKQLLIDLLQEGKVNLPHLITQISLHSIDCPSLD